MKPVSWSGLFVSAVLLGSCTQVQPDYGSVPPLLDKTKWEVIDLIGHPTSFGSGVGGFFDYDGWTVEPHDSKSISLYFDARSKRVTGFTVWEAGESEWIGGDGISATTNPHSVPRLLENRYGSVRCVYTETSPSRRFPSESQYFYHLVPGTQFLRKVVLTSSEDRRGVTFPLSVEMHGWFAVDVPNVMGHRDKLEENCPGWLDEIRR